VFFVVAVVVFNLIQKWQRQARRRLEEMKVEAPTAAPGREPPRPTPFGAEPWGRGPDAVGAEEESLEAQARPLPREIPAVPAPPVARPARVAMPAASPYRVPGARAPRQRPFRTAREVRQGIVAMTVLGPCRALDPYEPTQTEPPRT